MIIYNVTLCVEEGIEKEWLEWMREIHIPEVMETGKFVSCRLSKLLSHKEENSQNYSAQYVCKSMKELNEYQQLFSKSLQKKSLEKFADKMLAFRTELEIIEDFFYETI